MYRGNLISDIKILFVFSRRWQAITSFQGEKKNKKEGISSCFNSLTLIAIQDKLGYFSLSLFKEQSPRKFLCKGNHIGPITALVISSHLWLLIVTVTTQTNIRVMLLN